MKRTTIAAALLCGISFGSSAMGNKTTSTTTNAKAAKVAFHKKQDNSSLTYMRVKVCSGFAYCGSSQVLCYDNSAQLQAQYRLLMKMQCM